MTDLLHGKLAVPVIFAHVRFEFIQVFRDKQSSELLMIFNRVRFKTCSRVQVVRL